MNIFPDATENREYSKNFLLLFNEIRSIEESILIDCKKLSSAVVIYPSLLKPRLKI